MFDVTSERIPSKVCMLLPTHDHVLIAPEGAPTGVAFAQHVVGAALAAILH